MILPLYRTHTCICVEGKQSPVKGTEMLLAKFWVVLDIRSLQIDTMPQGSARFALMCFVNTQRETSAPKTDLSLYIKLSAFSLVQCLSLISKMAHAPWESKGGLNQLKNWLWSDYFFSGSCLSHGPHTKNALRK